jgi:hypothetical protein
MFSKDNYLIYFNHGVHGDHGESQKFCQDTVTERLVQGAGCKAHGEGSRELFRNFLHFIYMVKESYGTAEHAEDCAKHAKTNHLY